MGSLEWSQFGGDGATCPLADLIGAAPRIVKGSGVEHEAEINRGTINSSTIYEQWQREDSTSPDVEGFEADRKGATVKQREAVEPAAQ